jgi:signal transduction histidine kinase
LVEKIGTHANIIYGQSCKIARIARNLSKLSQPLELEIQELNLEEEMKAAVEIMSETAGKIKHFKTEDPHSQYVLITSYEPNLPLIRGDSQQLQQVFINLIINAAHAVEEKGRGTLSVGTRQSQNDTVIAYVYDSGIGMTPETLKKMWEPFFTTKKSGKGTGLGMAIVKKVMEAHGARIEVKSILGEGTKFDLIFPALKRE